MPDDDDNGEPLNVPLDTVCFIATWAQEQMGKTASSAPEGSGDEDDLAAEVLEARGRDSVGDELRTKIEDLDDEAQIDLVALMWLGRDEGEWDELRALAAQEHTPATAEYLLGTPLLSDYLMAGLDQLGLNCAEWLRRNG